ncbi:hypothetical protein AWR38_17635 [Idiomarina sp. WRN-38]|jgi:hypothetical protein|nr:hypothetical protein AUR68_17615 [Idiomarina sp. H105]OAE98329.1 hypothetical protein AWR38_17635 [Idiomarina sp. WRN-38]
MIKKCSLAVIGKVSAPASRIQVFFFWDRREVALKPRCDDAPQQAKYSLALISVTASADFWHTHPREALN